MSLVCYLQVVYVLTYLHLSSQQPLLMGEKRTVREAQMEQRILMNLRAEFLRDQHGMEDLQRQLQDSNRRLDRLDQLARKMDTTPALSRFIGLPNSSFCQLWFGANHDTDTFYFEDSCYSFRSENRSWESAQMECQEAGSNLAISDDDNIQNVLISKITGEEYFWIGAHDKEKEKTFVWNEDGSDVDSSGWKQDPWIENEPNDKGAGEDCLTLTASGWNDVDCKTKAAFICQHRLP